MSGLVVNKKGNTEFGLLVPLCRLAKSRSGTYQAFLTGSSHKDSKGDCRKGT